MCLIFEFVQLEEPLPLFLTTWVLIISTMPSQIVFSFSHRFKRKKSKKYYFNKQIRTFQVI